jgi:hypothetical protein
MWLQSRAKVAENGPLMFVSDWAYYRHIVPPRSYLLLARQYGEIYQLDLLGQFYLILWAMIKNSYICPYP